MLKEIIEKIGLKETNLNNGVSFVNDIKFYAYGIDNDIYCLAGNIDGTIEENGLILFFSKKSGETVKVTKEFLLDCTIEVIDLTIMESLKLNTKKMKFIIENGNVDCNNDKLNIEGLVIPENVLLTYHFNNKHPLGNCKVFKEEGILKAEADVPQYLLNGFPSIGFKVLKSEIDGQTGVYKVQEAELKYVSICQTPNTDPSIKRLSEQ